MDPDPLPYLFLFLGPLLFLLFTASEIALAYVNRSAIESKVRNQNKRALIVTQLIEKAPKFLLTTALMRSLGMLMVSGATVYLLSSIVNGYLLCVILLSIWAIMSSLRAFIRAKVLLDPELYALQLASFAQLGTMIFTPITFALRYIYRVILREYKEPLFEDILLSQNGLRLLIDTQKDENHIDDSEKAMIASILDLDNTLVREIMTPRIDMVTLSIDTDLNDILDVVIREGHSRIPVYQGNIDNIVGLLYAKDLLECYRSHQNNAKLEELLRTPCFVPDSKKINMLFQEMRANKIHIAIIVDEYGGTAGLVTIEDLLEQIVGAIQDEYDADEMSLVQLMRPDTYLINSRLSIDELEDLLDITVEDIDVDTLGGFIYTLSGCLPEPGAIVDYGSWRFTVVSVSGYRIEQVRAEKLLISASAAIERTNGVASPSSSILNYR